MFLGSKAEDTILDVFKVGLNEVIRQTGLPEHVQCRTTGCEIAAKSADFSKRVDNLRILFSIKPGVDPNQVSAAVAEAKLNARVSMNNGSCSLLFGALDWSAWSQIQAADGVVGDFAARSLRSRSWELKVVSYIRNDVNVNAMIEEMKKRRASDLHVRAGASPTIRVDNRLEVLDMPVLTAADMEEVTTQLGGEMERDRLAAERETSWQFHAVGVGYLRVSGYYKQGAQALAIRLIPEAPVAFEDLNIPMVVRNIADSHRGLFLVCGITGSGKSTTLASMIDYINAIRTSHIITIEDPTEYVYDDKQSIISQRQIGRDTFSFANGLRGALREDPDVILVGEMRDVETIRAALSAAETGHLVFSTLHTMSAVDTVNRIISFFPQTERELIRQELAFTLRGVVCQRLLRRKGGPGRVPCVEILLGGQKMVRDAILDGEIDKLYGIIEMDSDMRTFDQHAVELYQKGLVSKDEAISACSNEEAFQRIISGIKSSEGRRLLK